jgi:hypothetical protein
MGRNEFDGFAARQIMERDGFKVKTDFLGNKVGKTDDWFELHLTSTIPNKYQLFITYQSKYLKLFFDWHHCAFVECSRKWQ